MNARLAFAAGYAPRAASPYFTGLELLAQASRASDLELEKQIGEERDRVVQRRDEALARLDETEQLLADAGAQPVARPPDASAYEAWTDAVFDAFNEVIEPGSAQAVLYLLGHVLGEAMAVLEAFAVLSRLREVSPDHLLLRAQGESLESERSTAERRLARLASHALLPPPVQEATAMAAHVVAEAAPSGGHRGRAERATTAARELATQAERILAALS